ncbi:MAG: membrane dipeptidase [Chloroflexi bacterium]|nr:membrane dipeptidase [Chloroflexota bacterium]
MLNTVALRYPAVGEEARELHARVPVVDLLVATPLFRAGFVQRRRHGHADLPRLIQGGVDLVGFSIATRHPDLRGTLSRPHFWSLGLSTRSLGSDMAIAGALIDRIEDWARRSRGRLRLLPASDDLDGVMSDRMSGVVSAFVGIQGGHVLEGQPANVAALAARGVRMFAPAHVMDNALVGSNTGRHSGGLTGFGRDIVAELERQRIMVDLAHMSVRGIHDALPLLRRPFVLSHTGLSRLAGAGSRLPGRRFTAGRRNLADREARMVAEAGGLIGLTLSTKLLGGDGLDAMVRTVDAAVELAGPKRVALGSDMDGALRMLTDAAGLPAVTTALLAAGSGRSTVSDFLGGNALRHLGAAWASDRSAHPAGMPEGAAIVSGWR